MKITRSRAGQPGYVSYALVLGTGLILTLLTLAAYQRAMTAHEVQAKVVLKADYAEKEDAILRAMVAITPNRAIRAMVHNSNSNSSTKNPLRWETIYEDALEMANVRKAVSTELYDSLNKPDSIVANVGDADLDDYENIFKPYDSGSRITRGMKNSLGEGFPVPLSYDNSTTYGKDDNFPIISHDKYYGADAQDSVGASVDDYPLYNLLSYPQINFGYAQPGDPFVAKRNWWAFSMSVADHDDEVTGIAVTDRDFVLSIYEVPSQLAISASAFMSLGEFESGEAWGNVNITGGVFAGKAVVEGETSLNALASRRGMTLSDDTSIGGQSFSSSPFAPGLREDYLLTQGTFFPVSLASESGRVAFIPINRGADYFDRFSHEEESDTISTTSWNDYSIGALQCAMRLDIVDVVSQMNQTPTELRFSYLKDGERKEIDIPLLTDDSDELPSDYTYVCNENESYDFGDSVVDVAYGDDKSWAYQTSVSGVVEFNNARFGDPKVGTFKAGYYRPSYPFEVKELDSGKMCIAVFPERFEDFLVTLDADATDVNHSLVVNVDYSASTGSLNLSKPSIPCTDLDFGLVLLECSDLSSFTKGFSIVTNLRTYIGDDFNVVPISPPSGYTPASGSYYPPCSIFAPEKRYGVEVDPYAVDVEGQVGSLASEDEENPIRPLDSKTLSGTTLSADRVTVNLKPIAHPAELPPIFMMNWLVVLEEVRSEFIGN
ncbi:MAG: hypothetical protein Q7R22_011810 [Verrucomicrobiota bacterium JB025]|nr:hypothetical protein [Verrucomicrobiota bacterium JB025]